MQVIVDSNAAVTLSPAAQSTSTVTTFVVDDVTYYGSTLILGSVVDYTLTVAASANYIYFVTGSQTNGRAYGYVGALNREQNFATLKLQCNALFARQIT